MTLIRHLLFLLVFTVLPVTPLRAEEPTLRDEVRRLLTDLDAADRATRADAERRLLELGPAVLPWLPPPELLPDVSVREAVRRVRIDLERRQARQSAEASRVTLHGKMSLHDALRAITRQTGNVMELSREAAALGDHTVQPDCEQEPFWPCLDRLIEPLRLEYALEGSAKEVVLMPRDDKANAIRVAYSGPFRIAVTKAELRPNLTNRSQSIVRLQLLISVEPRLRPLFLHFAAKDVEAYTAQEFQNMGRFKESGGLRPPLAGFERTLNGVSLRPLNPEAEYELPLGDGGRHLTVQLDYLTPRSQEPKTINLKGKMLLQTAAGAEKIVFQDLPQATGVARRRGGVTVRMQRVEFTKETDGDGTQADIAVAVVYDTGGPAFESHRTWLLHNAVWMQSPKGQIVEPADLRTNLQTNGGVAVEYRFEHLSADAAQWAFVYEAPTLLINIPLNLRLDAVPVTRRS